MKIRDSHGIKRVLMRFSRIKKTFNEKEEILTNMKHLKKVLMKNKRFSQVKKSTYEKEEVLTKMVTNKNKCVEIEVLIGGLRGYTSVM